jgi:hypothetical protein
MSKRRVESCFTIAPPRGPLRDVNGTWRWTYFEFGVHYSVHTCYSELRVCFEHSGSMAEHAIPLVATKPHYGGIRWWFLCPKCNQRVSTLHKPRETYGFFCRRCHNLTYESSQSSGTKKERLFQTKARSLGSTTREARRVIRLQCSPPVGVHEIKRPILNDTRDRRTGFALFVAKQARGKGLSV